MSGASGRFRVSWVAGSAAVVGWECVEGSQGHGCLYGDRAVGCPGPATVGMGAEEGVVGTSKAAKTRLRAPRSLLLLLGAGDSSVARKLWLSLPSPTPSGSLGLRLRLCSQDSGVTAPPPLCVPRRPPFRWTDMRDSPASKCFRQRHIAELQIFLTCCRSKRRDKGSISRGHDDFLNG